MRWKYDHYESNTPASGEGAWLELDRIIHVDWRHAVSDGFCVSPERFTSITNETYPALGQGYGVGRCDRDRQSRDRLEDFRGVFDRWSKITVSYSCDRAAVRRLVRIICTALLFT